MARSSGSPSAARGNGAWFQCTVLRRWDTAPYGDVLGTGAAAAADDSDGGAGRGTGARG